ncbi:hypothetical protein P879_00667 [Paragonimus westermani]|uniref:Uncharacterized protein n=1 Tax=Paragonimus westermani TaxID=34504 RepID=A0A8T0DLF3_9TREM|nr:hypothetical protein P879_00667 [Paragonimus westermani]
MSNFVTQLIYIILLGAAHSCCTHTSVMSTENGQLDSLNVTEENSRNKDDVSVAHLPHTVHWSETTVNPEWSVPVDDYSTNSTSESEGHILTDTVNAITANASTSEQNQTEQTAPVPTAMAEPALGTHKPHSNQHASHWDMFENEDETGTVTGLLDRMLDSLNVSSKSWNKYIYITALESPDGSLYIPYNHRQGTRNHLATLLGQRMGVNENRNDQTFIESSKLTTVLPTTEERVTDKTGTDPVKMNNELSSTQDSVVSPTNVEKLADDFGIDNGNVTTTAQTDEDKVGQNATTWSDLFTDRQLTDSINRTNSTSSAEREHLSTTTTENELPGEMFIDGKNNASELNSELEKTESPLTKLAKLTEYLFSVFSPAGQQDSKSYTMNNSVSDVNRVNSNHPQGSVRQC